MRSTIEQLKHERFQVSTRVTGSAYKLRHVNLYNTLTGVCQLAPRRRPYPAYPRVFGTPLRLGDVFGFDRGLVYGTRGRAGRVHILVLPRTGKLDGAAEFSSESG